MAEIALGGIRATFGKSNADPCSHTESISVYSAGVQRVICESCGHLSIRLVKGLTIPVERSMFARPADIIAADGSLPAASIFSVDRSFGLRSRPQLAGV